MMTSENGRRSKEDAEKLLKACSQDGGLKLTSCFHRESERLGLSIVDAQIIIRRGYVHDEPERENSTGQWKYRISGTSSDSEYLTISFCFNSDEEAVLITIFKG
jgi:hypothetical protein